MGSLGINYSHYKHPPMNMSAPGGGVIEDVYAPAPGRTLTGTYEGGENFTLPCYGTSAGVSISYTYSIPDGGSATIDDALIGSIGGVPTDFIPWSSITIDGATIVGPKYWTDGDPGSTIPESGNVYATADFLDPTPGTIYNAIRGVSSTGINIYDLTIHAASMGSVCQTAPITGATCELTAATEAHLGPYSQDNFDITYTPAVRLANTISTTVTFTALKTLYEPFSVDMQALAANDGIAVFSDTPPTCMHPLLFSASYAGGTGEIPEEDIYHTPPPIKFISPGTITEGETWSFDVSIGTAGATCDQAILSIVLGNDASEGPIGYAVLYALITCDEEEPPECPPAPIDVDFPLGNIDPGDSFLPRSATYTNFLNDTWTENLDFSEYTETYGSIIRGFDGIIRFPEETITGRATISVTSTRTADPTNPTTDFESYGGVPEGYVFLINPITEDIINYAQLTNGIWEDGVYTIEISTAPIVNPVLLSSGVAFYIGVLTFYYDPPHMQYSWAVDTTLEVTACFEEEPEEPPDFWISWWEPGSRAYERGIDRGVLYFDDGRVVPWGGLTGVSESLGRNSESVYFDGVKLAEIVTPEGFSASVSAITYPKQFEEAYGSLPLRRGVYLGGQRPKTFGFCYRTKLGTDLNEDAGYKLHIIYNILAIPGDRSYTTISNEPNLTEFNWEFKTTPDDAPGYRPSAYLVIDSTKVTPSLLVELEEMLYGTPDIPPRLPTLAELLEFINNFNNFINIIDNGDGTWEANTLATGIINDLGGEVYEIQHANIQWTSAETYLISPTPDPPA